MENGWTWSICRWIILNYLLNMLILPSYVKLPEGTSQLKLGGKEKINKNNQWKISQYWLSQTLLGPTNGDHSDCSSTLMILMKSSKFPVAVRETCWYVLKWLNIHPRYEFLSKVVFPSIPSFLEGASFASSSVKYEICPSQTCLFSQNCGAKGERLFCAFVKHGKTIIKHPPNHHK